MSGREARVCLAFPIVVAGAGKRKNARRGVRSNGDAAPRFVI